MYIDIYVIIVIKTYHTFQRACRPPAEAQCTIRIAPPTIHRPFVPDISIKTDIVGKEGQDCNDGEFKRHEKCKHFYECYHGKLQKRTCYPGLHWDGVVRIIF